MVLSIIIRHTDIVKNSVFEPVLRKDFTYGLTFTTIKQQSIVSNIFLSEENHRSIILVLHPTSIWKSYGGINNYQRHQYRQKTIFEPMFRKDSISGLTFAVRKRKNHYFKRIMNRRQSKVCSTCYISPIHLEEMWWYQ